MDATNGRPEASVAEALKKYQMGNHDELTEIIDIMKKPNTRDVTLEHYLKELKHSAVYLGRDLDAEVGIILKMKWLDRGGGVQECYKSFIVALVSAQTIYLKSCLRMVVRQFLPTVDKGSNDEGISEDQRKKHQEAFDQLHSLLIVILQMVPMSPTILLPLLSEHFPYMNKSSYCHEWYLKNLIRITTYLPMHRNAIVLILIDRMVKLDVRAPRNELFASDDSDHEEEDMFEMDDVQNTPKDAQIKETTVIQPMKHEVANHLDVMLDIFFGYIYDVCHPNGKLDWEATKKLYRELLQDFDQIILPTHAVHHTPFIMYYICSFREELTLGFIDYLWKKVYSPSTQVIFRQTAICYISSLLARAKYIPVGVVKSTLDAIVEWLHSYAKHSNSTNKAGLVHHGTFYAVFQTAIYVLVFRHKEILEKSKGYKYIQGLNLQTLVSCGLNPLKFCLPIITKTFSSIMRQHQILFCDTIIERNRRNALTVEGSQPHLSVNPLDSFFPFDPYLLKRSSRFIKHHYREFEGTPVVEEDVDKDEEVAMEEEMFSTTPGTSLPMSPTTPTDFLMYGTSPGFKNL